jgi:hypothetical protein
MEINGVWVGYGLGDATPKVKAMKEFLKKKFSYASVLDDTETYDQTMVDVVSRMQKNYGLPAATGVMNYATQLKCGFAQPPKITYLSAQGTGVDMWTGYPADTGRAISTEYFMWQPIGNYPASVVNPQMGGSVQMGVDEAVRLLTGSGGPGPFYTSGPIALSGYSQGALVVAKLWRDEFLNPNGRLHNRLNDVVAAVTWGNPMRSPGIANGNVSTGQAIPKNLDGAVTGGIAGPEDLRPAETPWWWYDFANDGDLYAAAPVGVNPWTDEAPAGMVETNIFNIVQRATIGNIISILKDLGHPIGTIEAIYNGGLFASQGTNAPHWQYNIDGAVRFLNSIGAKVYQKQIDDAIATANWGTPPVGPIKPPIKPPVGPVPTPPKPSGLVRFLKDLPQVRKELVAGLTSGVGIVAALEAAAPHTGTGPVAAIAAVGGLMTGLLAFLTNNKVVEVVDDVGKI